MATPSTSTKRPRAPSSPSSSFRDREGHASSDPPYKASRLLSPDYSDTSGSSDVTLTAHSSSLSPSTHPSASTHPSGIGIGIDGTTTAGGGAPLLCNLPPTCHRHPTPIANTTELERHYAKYHAHVCEQRGCGCVFPEARLLELHQTECHDPLAQIRKERGEKIFQCHIPTPTCGRYFLTPKTRRLHLIQSHSYPKEYFFAVTNKGIGGLLKKWGEGASMVRKEWKAREGVEDGKTEMRNQDVDMRRYRAEEDGMDEDDGEDSNEDEEEEEEEEEEETNENTEESEEPDRPFVEEDDEPIDLEATPRMLPRTTGIVSPQSSISTPKQRHAHLHPHLKGASNNTNNNNNSNNDNADVAGLTNSLDSLALVPDSIRFGRGGKIGGFVPPHASGHHVGRGRGGRGRGRGRGEPNPLGGGRGKGGFGIGRGGAQAQYAVGGANVVAGGARVGGQASGHGVDAVMGDAAVNVNAIPIARGRGRGRGVPRGRGRGVVNGRGRGV